MWYYLKNHQRFGPFTAAEMQKMCLNDEINERTYVFTNGMNAWQHYADTELVHPVAKDTESVKPSKKTSQQNSAAVKAKQRPDQKKNASKAKKASSDKTDSDISETEQETAMKPSGIKGSKIETKNPVISRKDLLYFLLSFAGISIVLCLISMTLSRFTFSFNISAEPYEQPEYENEPLNPAEEENKGGV